MQTFSTLSIPQFTADGVAYTFGLFFVKISEDLHETKSATSWIASIMAGMTYGVGKNFLRPNNNNPSSE